MKVLYCSAYYDEHVTTGANKRFKEIGKVIQPLENVTCMTPSETPPDWTHKHIRLRYGSLGRVLSSFIVAWKFYFGRFDVLISDLVPTIPSKNTFFLVHDLRQFSEFRRHNSWWSSWVYKANLKLQKNIITVSDFTKNQIQEVSRNKQEIVVSFNGVYVSDTAFSTCVEKKYDFIYVATFEERKNHRLLVLALSIYAERNPQFKFLLIGRDLGLREEVFEMIEARGLSANFEYVESCSEYQLLEYYKRSRVFVSPSLYEGFGMPVVEAEAAGLQVICSDIAVFREVASESCQFFNVEDPYDLVHALERGLSRASLVPHEANVSERFLWSKIGENLLNDVRKVVDRDNS